MRKEVRQIRKPSNRGKEKERDTLEDAHGAEGKS
jgi:hypothetical protein